jgi:iron complex outermembrane recepter protein
MRRLLPLLAAILALVARVGAEDFAWAELSLEDLMEIDVSLASRGQERLFDTPAAAYVLTGEDIRRSGARSIPEALRLVPGIEVARMDANKWGVASRGFNGRFANKLLVLIDGRAVYTPFYSGVMWETHDVPLDDIERIEIVRGPGGTLWGANAVNGIINIVTHSAAETRGALLRAGGGSEERAFAHFRYGFELDEKSHLRVYGKTFLRDAFVDSLGGDGGDDWRTQSAGFRLDRDLGQGSLSAQGSIYDVERSQVYRFATLLPPYRNRVEDESQLSGASLQGRWTRSLDSGDELRLQLYYDRTVWQDTLIGEKRNTLDADFQYRFARGRRHELVWGAGYRLSADEISNTPIFSLDPDRRTSPLYSVFVHDRISFLSDRVQLFVGSKLEHNDYTGFEYQPSARLALQPHAQHMLWAATTRAVRTPSRTDDDAMLLNRTLAPGELFGSTVPVQIVNAGDRRFKSEILHAFELGYRFYPREGLSLDLASFYNQYTQLRTGKLVRPISVAEPVPHLVAPLPASNLLAGDTYGMELAFAWQAAHRRLRAGYSYLYMDLRAVSPANPVAEFEEGASPRHQFFLSPSLDVYSNLQFDATLRYVDELPTYLIDAYAELDLRLGWQPLPQLEVALVGRDVLRGDHAEFNDIFVDILPTRAQRSFYASLGWKF